MIYKIFGMCLAFTLLSAVLAASPLNRQFTMGFGKRSPLNGEPENAAEDFNYVRPWKTNDDDNDMDKRYDLRQFQMGFGKRAAELNKRLNQFHMGLGKRAFHMGLGKRDIDEPEYFLKRSFHMGLGKR